MWHLPNHLDKVVSLYSFLIKSILHLNLEAEVVVVDHVHGPKPKPVRIPKSSLRNILRPILFYKIIISPRM
jgi:hypothetical protein